METTCHLANIFRILVFEIEGFSDSKMVLCYVEKLRSEKDFEKPSEKNVTPLGVHGITGSMDHRW